MWNAISVSHLAILVCLHASCQSAADRLLVWLASLATSVIWPLSLYVTSPAALVVALVIAFSSGISMRKDDVLLMSTSQRCSPLCKVKPLSFRADLLPFTAFLFSSMYNFVSDSYHSIPWLDIYELVPNVSPSTVRQVAYSMWFDMKVPAYIPDCGSRSHIGCSVEVFVLIWSVLPFLYSSYFLVIYSTSTKPTRCLQQCLCMLGVLHMLFITDLIDYRLGRGPHTSAWISAIAHWCERVVWRISVLLCTYRIVLKARWKQVFWNPALGAAVHYMSILFGLFFVVCQCAPDLFWFVRLLVTGKGRVGPSDLIGGGLYMWALVVLMGANLCFLLTGQSEYIVMVPRGQMS